MSHNGNKTVTPDIPDAASVRLSGEQFENLHTALLNAFPNDGAFRLLVRTGLEQNFDSIAGGSDLSERVHNLIVWAEAQGQLTRLVEKAYRKNPNNPDIQRFAVEVLKLPAILADSFNAPIPAKASHDAPESTKQAGNYTYNNSGSIHVTGDFIQGHVTQK